MGVWTPLFTLSWTLFWGLGMAYTLEKRGLVPP